MQAFTRTRLRDLSDVVPQKNRSSEERFVDASADAIEVDLVAALTAILKNRHSK